MSSLLLYSATALFAFVYCTARAVLDFRARRYLWGIADLISAMAFLLMPVQTHAVKIDLPAD